jgi:Tfp pilus assembly protein PilW
MKRSFKSLQAGFTAAEMMVSLACSMIILAAVITAGVSLQRSFAASEGYSGSEGDQLRVMDYISMDCRRATSAAVANGVLTLKIPNYYSSNSPVNPSLTSSGTVQYGSGWYEITYLQSGSNFNRQVVVKDSSGTVTSTTTTAIAKNVSTFTVTPQDLTISVSCSIMFFPTFTHNAGSGTWRSGQSAPSNAVGSNGDWYVIDPTASDSTTVGNVYFKSSGAYSLLQNVKATTVYCNTFLRNAVARQ